MLGSSEQDWSSGPFVYRICDGSSNRPNHQLLAQVCEERGWQEQSESLHGGHWNLWWRPGAASGALSSRLQPWQVTSHFRWSRPAGHRGRGQASSPSVASASSLCCNICRKDSLARYLRRMKQVHGAIFDFSPPAFNLPMEYTKLVAEYTRRRRPDSFGGRSRRRGEEEQKERNQLEEEEENPSAGWCWICKPVGQSCGRGIFLFRELGALSYDCHVVVQRYVSRPLLVGGRKCDLRLYAAVVSRQPPAVYLYRDGLVRFASQKYAPEDLHNLRAHLTNSALNARRHQHNQQQYHAAHLQYHQQQQDALHEGKWSLRQLRRHLRGFRGADDRLLWLRVLSLACLTLCALLPPTPPAAGIDHHQDGGAETGCFQLLGLDVLLDRRLKPWLLEVNSNPAVRATCSVDLQVKRPMLHDLFDLLMLPTCNPALIASFSSPLLPCASSSSSPSSSPSSLSSRRPPQATAKGKRSSFSSRKSPTLQGKCWLSSCRRNWWAPPTQVGEWVRILPLGEMHDGAENDGTVSTRGLVQYLRRVLKNAHQILDQYPEASDAVFQDMLSRTLGLSHSLWMPPGD